MPQRGPIPKPRIAAANIMAADRQKIAECGAMLPGRAVLAARCIPVTVRFLPAHQKVDSPSVFAEICMIAPDFESAARWLTGLVFPQVRHSSSQD
jgi:hypothetical protein